MAKARTPPLVLATQSIEDFASVDLLRTVVESCPTKLLLANPSLDRKQYAELFQMNEMELDAADATGAAPAAPAEAAGTGKVLTLNASNPAATGSTRIRRIDNERAAAAFRRIRILAAGLERLDGFGLRGVPC